MTVTAPEPTTHDDLVVLTAWMAQQGYAAHTVAEAVEKPHKWVPELRVARAILDHERENPLHTCRPEASDYYWYCDGGPQHCPWTFNCTCPAAFNPSDDCVIHGGL